jgi:hypothetical protein
LVKFDSSDGSQHDEVIDVFHNHAVDVPQQHTKHVRQGHRALDAVSAIGFGASILHGLHIPNFGCHYVVRVLNR